MITSMEIIHKNICHLGEGPIWNAECRRLFWTDIFNKTIWVYDPAAGSSSIFWTGEYKVGGFAFTRSGDMVLCTDRGVYLQRLKALKSPNGEPELLFDIPLAENEMFNDITVYPEGRIYAGTIKRPDFTNIGKLYRLEKGRKPEVVLEGLHCSNGMTFSLDEKYFFHTDSLMHRITKYEYDRRTGSIKKPSVYFQGIREMGLPDGITLDAENHVWVAFWGGSCIRRIDPSGAVDTHIAVPAKQPSSVMFGGDELNELYITSAAENADNIKTGFCKDGSFSGGQVYRLRPGVNGRKEWLADF